MTEDALLAALIAEYGTTLERLQRSFVGPPELEPPEPLGPDQFAREYDRPEDPRHPADEYVSAFRELQHAARTGAGITTEDNGADEATYHQYREWLPFAHRNQVVLGRIAETLGYELA
jgi:hypothetical protein